MGKLRVVAGHVFVAGALVAGPRPVEAQRTIEFPRFEATIQVDSTGRVSIEERITTRFTGEWNGIFRRIPVSYASNHGVDTRLALRMDGVEAGDGSALEYEVSQQGPARLIRIRVPGAHDATRVVVVRYSVANALRFFEDHDELYWNVTGTEWEGPLGEASATVVLPEGATGIRSALFTGADGARESDGTFVRDGVTLRFDSDRALGWGRGMTVAVGWTRGAVVRPSVVKRTARFIASNWLLFLPLGPAGFFFIAWLRRGRDPKTRHGARSITPQWDPPADLRPAEVGALVDSRLNSRDLAATLVDLAVRGYVSMAEVSDDGDEKGDVEFARIRGRASWDGLETFERSMLAGVFRESTANPFAPALAESTRLSKIRGKFSDYLMLVRDELWQGMVDKGLYDRRPDQVRGMWWVWALLATLGVFCVGLVARATLFVPVPSIFLATALTLLPSIVFAQLMPARTMAGSRTRDRVLGLEEFLRRVDGDRLARMRPDATTFERLLPYALALGVEERWAEAFAEIGIDPPEWYTTEGTTVASPSRLVQALHHTTGRTARAMIRPSRSAASSSGLGGGGYSGGGFGGGGGGGW